MKDNEELFEIVSNNDMMCHDGLFSKDGLDFPYKIHRISKFYC